MENLVALISIGNNGHWYSIFSKKLPTFAIIKNNKK